MSSVQFLRLAIPRGRGLFWLRGGKREFNEARTQDLATVSPEISLWTGNWDLIQCY